MTSPEPRGGGWRGRKRWAWILAAAALVAMTIGLFLPSYEVVIGMRLPGSGAQSPPDAETFLGWRCAWVVTEAWEETLLDGAGLAISSYRDVLILSYLPINFLFVISPLFLWLTERTRRLGWLFRPVYGFVVLQVAAWWVLHLGAADDAMIRVGYWFWLAAYVLLAAAFWVMPRAKAPGERVAGDAALAGPLPY